MILAIFSAVLLDLRLILFPITTTTAPVSGTIIIDKSASLRFIINSKEINTRIFIGSTNNL
jgi:hypothetical protein